MSGVSLSLQLCRTTAVPDESGPLGKASMSPDKFRIYPDTPILQHFGFASALPKGSIVMRMCVGGDETKGVGIASVHHDYRPRNLQPGQSILYDAKGSMLVAGNNGGMQLTAPSSLKIGAPGFSVSGTIRSKIGETATFTTPTGRVVSIRRGQVSKVTKADGSDADVVNLDWFRELAAEIRGLSLCSLIQELSDEVQDIINQLFEQLQDEFKELNEWIELLTPPTSLQGLITWAEKLITKIVGPQYKAQLTLIKQIQGYAQGVGMVLEAVGEAAANSTNCSITGPSIPIPNLTMPAQQGS